MTHPGWEDWKIVAPTGEVPASLLEKQARSRRRRRRRIRKRIFRVVRWGLASVALLIVGVLGWVALEARGVQDDLEAAASGTASIQEDVLAGNTDGVQATITTVQQHARSAEQVTSRPHWAIASALPWIGPNIGAVRTVADAVDALAQDGLPNLQAAVDVLNPSALAPTDGAIDLTPVLESREAVIGVDAVVQESLADLQGIDRDRLLPFVAEAVDRATGEFEDASMQTRTAARVVQLLPPMLGNDGPREYLLLVQNNAEQRATGGIPGVLLQIHVEEGRLEVVDRQSGSSMGQFEEPILPLTDNEVALFGTQLGRYMQDVTFTPHFPRTGELAAAMWEERHGVAVDGVLSVDPVALQSMLAATGEITVDGVRLTSEDAAAMLLNGIYLDRPNPQEQDAFFAEAASEVFTQLTSGAGDAGAAVRTLADAAAQGRLLLWSAHPEEQQHLNGTMLAGELDGQVSGDRPVVGVFLNDGSAAKIGYYLDTTIELTANECRADGSQTLTMHVTLVSTAPSDAATTLPEYVTGENYGYVEPGQQRLNILLYAPEGGAIASIAASDGESAFLSQVHEGLPVAARSLTLDPGGTLELEVEIFSGPGSSGDPVLRTTPGARAAENTVSMTSCGTD